MGLVTGEIGKENLMIAREVGEKIAGGQAFLLEKKARTERCEERCSNRGGETKMSNEQMVTSIVSEGKDVRVTFEEMPITLLRCQF